MVSKVFGCEEFISEVSLLIQGHCQGQKQNLRSILQNTSWSGFSGARDSFLMYVCYFKVIVKVKRTSRSFGQKFVIFQNINSTYIYGLLFLGPLKLCFSLRDASE